jgi:hypothetical protein
MRRIGNILMVAGAAVGVLSGIWLWTGPTAGGLAWVVGIGLIKLTFIAGLALMGTGAVALRLANKRNDDPPRLEP